MKIYQPIIGLAAKIIMEINALIILIMDVIESGGRP